MSDLLTVAMPLLVALVSGPIGVWAVDRWRKRPGREERLERREDRLYAHQETAISELRERLDEVEAELIRERALRVRLELRVAELQDANDRLQAQLNR